MAKINGYEVKGVKEFQGHDGMGYFMCNVYHNGKKIASYADDAWCGPAHINYISKEEEEDFWKFLFKYYSNKEKSFMSDYYEHNKEAYEKEKTRILKYYPYIAMEDINPCSVCANDECFIHDLMELKHMETKYKKDIKKHPTHTTYVHMSDEHFCEAFYSIYKDDIEQKHAKIISRFKSKCLKKDKIKIRIYKTLNDFNMEI